MNCPHCNSINTRKNGTLRGRQRWKCKDCGRTSIEPSDLPRGRQCIGDRPMTPAERKRRQRRKQRTQHRT